ncbi:hypothetical protein [Indibacter alkaliphilus]|nr:hypothetical protein [Indibacter alkaliphilus]
MKKILPLLLLSFLWIITSNAHAQSQTENDQTFKGPLQKGKYTLGGNFFIGEDITSVQAGVGYFFSDKIGLGIDGTYVNELFLVQLLPRYYFHVLDNTYIFLELGVTAGDIFGVSGGAGVTYFINERIGFQGRLNNFSGGGVGLVVLFGGKNR